MGSPGQIDYEKGTVKGAFHLGWKEEQKVMLLEEVYRQLEISYLKKFKKNFRYTHSRMC